MEYTICHVCGGRVTEPEEGLFNCTDCGNELDVRAFVINDKEEDEGEYDDE